MQPNEPTQHPIDYLDSISAASNQPSKKNDLMFFAVIGIGLLVTLLVGALILFGGSSSNENLSRLSVRLGNLQTAADSAQKNITGSKLRSTNINLAFALTNANRDIAEHLLARGIDPKKISSGIISSESTEELSEALEDARLNAIYDRVYAREMSYQIETTLALLRQMESKEGSSSTKEYLSKTIKDLEPFQKQFIEYNTTE